MNESKFVYKGPSFEDPGVNPVKYCDDYFQMELDLESDLFFELRRDNNIKPHRINESSEEELKEIKSFFNKNKETFFFLFKNNNFIGCILFLNNYIQALSIDRKYQRKDYGTKLTKYAINKILLKGHKEVTLKVLGGNIPAMNLYKKLGFEVVD